MNQLFSHQMRKFTEVLERNGSIDRLYSTLKTDDLADAVMTALNIINETKLKMPECLEKEVKCEERSGEFRLKGNELLQNRFFRTAMICYNLALLFAPTNSESMILALSNRSALLLQAMAPDECLKDIERCRAMKCSAEIIRKLEARRVKCAGTSSIVKFNAKVFNLQKNTFATEYFNFDLKRNKDISCVSEDVGVVKQNGLTKIIATRNIELGQVVAIEPAFVAVLDKENYYTSCYYCHKLSLNLIPCDGCCKALFCDEECRKQCFKDYHKIECQIMDAVEGISNTGKCKLPVVAALKLREMSGSWDSLILHSLKIGKSGLRDSSISELYDQRNIKSILSFNDDKHFIHGKIFNQCFLYAIIIKYLSDIPSYLPQDGKKRTDAQRALARIMLSLYVKFPFELDIQNSVYNLSTRDTRSEPDPSIGLFSFACKLTHSCVPNLLSVGLGNKLALIAVRSIKKGTELTISFPGHWCEIAYQGTRSMRLFSGAELRCRCPVCIEDWCSFGEAKPVRLSNEQKSCFRRYNSKLSIFTLFGIGESGEQFREICSSLKMFQDFGNTREFKTMFRDFRMRLTLFQQVYTNNLCL